MEYVDDYDLNVKKCNKKCSIPLLLQVIKSKYGQNLYKRAIKSKLAFSGQNVVKFTQKSIKKHQKKPKIITILVIFKISLKFEQLLFYH